MEVVWGEEPRHSASPFWIVGGKIKIKIKKKRKEKERKNR
jgi:hypothetical protein